MKLIIPPECQIGAIKYSIWRNDFVLEKQGKSGSISSEEQKIRIAHRETSQEFLVLMHEACHGICSEQGIAPEEGNEDFIKALSTGITIFLQSLDIEPDFSQIPEEKRE